MSEQKLMEAKMLDLSDEVDRLKEENAALKAELAEIQGDGDRYDTCLSCGEADGCEDSGGFYCKKCHDRNVRECGHEYFIYLKKENQRLRERVGAIEDAARKLMEEHGWMTDDCRCCSHSNLHETEEYWSLEALLSKEPPNA